MASRNGSSMYEVSGPTVEPPKGAPVAGAAISFAQYVAGRHETEATWYVRTRDGAAVAHVTRLGDGVIETRVVGHHTPSVEVPETAALDLTEEVDAS